MFVLIIWLLAGALLCLSLFKDREKTQRSLRIAWKFFCSMALLVLLTIWSIGFLLSILPPDLISKVIGQDSGLKGVGLFDVWVPRPVIEKAMGKSSGLKGILVSYFVGTAAMGPLYVAFPIGLSLLRKGASLFNVSIFLCVWASIKIPMILFEVKFLGADFAFLRLALTIPGIMAISWIINLVLKRSRHYEEA